MKRYILSSAVRFIASLAIAILLMLLLINLWQNLSEKTLQSDAQSGSQVLNSPSEHGINISKFSAYTMRSFFLIILALIVSSLCTAISLLLSIRFSRLPIVGLSFKAPLYLASVIPYVFAGYFIRTFLGKTFNISLTYDLLAPATLRWIYYVIPAIILGVGDGFLNELLSNSEEEIESIKRENYVKMAKLMGANIRKHIWQELTIRVSRAWFSRISALISGTVIIEYIFNLPGLGWLAFKSAEKHDTWQLLSVLFCSIFLVSVLNLFHRILAAKLDPRLR